MARLILLNGPPGSGKSTLARRWVDDHPLTALLDVDRVRAMVGGWQQHRTEAGLLARTMTLAMATAHLGGGHDVLVAQFLGRTEFVDQLAGCATDCGVPFVELALLAGADEARRRFDARTAAAADPLHVEAAADVDAAAYDEMYQRLLGILALRPHTRVIRTVTGEIDAAYAALVEALHG